MSFPRCTTGYHFTLTLTHKITSLTPPAGAGTGTCRPLNDRSHQETSTSFALYSCIAITPWMHMHGMEFGQFFTSRSALVSLRSSFISLNCTRESGLEHTHTSALLILKSKAP